MSTDTPAAEIVAAVEVQLAAGLVFQAFEAASAGLDQFTHNGSLRVLRALALARTGAVNEAVLQLTPWLDRVIAAGRSADLVRVIGVYHEAWRQSGMTAPLAEAVRIAQLVAKREPGVWACAHAAALAHLADMPDRARHHAEAASLGWVSSRTAPHDKERVPVPISVQTIRGMVDKLIQPTVRARQRDGLSRGDMPPAGRWGL